MPAERQVRLLRLSQDQVFEIPREFEFDAKEVILRRQGSRLVVESVPKSGLLALLARLKPIHEDFPDVDAGIGPSIDKSSALNPMD